MNIIINRFNQFKESLDGYLIIGDQRVCDTAENIATALPVGTYDVEIIRDPVLRRKLPFIVSKVLPIKGELEGVSIRPGHGIFGTPKPHIIVGERIVAGCMKHSNETFARLIDRLDKCQLRKELITLTIVENISRFHRALVPTQKQYEL